MHSGKARAENTVEFTHSVVVGKRQNILPRAHNGVAVGDDERVIFINSDQHSLGGQVDLGHGFAGVRRMVVHMYAHDGILALESFISVMMEW